MVKKSLANSLWILSNKNNLLLLIVHEFVPANRDKRKACLPSRILLITMIISLEQQNQATEICNLVILIFAFLNAIYCFIVDQIKAHTPFAYISVIRQKLCRHFSVSRIRCNDNKSVKESDCLQHLRALNIDPHKCHLFMVLFGICSITSINIFRKLLVCMHVNEPTFDVEDQQCKLWMRWKIASIGVCWLGCQNTAKHCMSTYANLWNHR